MPCQYYTDDQYLSMAQDRSKWLSEQLTTTTQLLCYLCGRAESDGTIDELPEQLQTWWRHHLEQDTKRVYESMQEHLSSFDDRPLLRPTKEAVADHFIEQAKNAHPVSDWHIDWFRGLAAKACRGENT